MKVHIIAPRAEIIVPPGQYEIGRGYLNQVYIFGPPFPEGKQIGDEHKTVSRHQESNGKVANSHLSMIVNEESVALRDDGSKRGSSVNNVQFRDKTLNEHGSYDIRLGENFHFELRLS